MKIGYARVSSSDQDLDLQLNALRIEGCELIFQEKVSASVEERPELQRMISQLCNGDEVIVWRLDRLGRSLPHLISLVDDFSLKGIAFTSISDKIDTLTPSGKLIFHIFCSLAQFERELIRERTMAGLVAARLKGNTGGRPKGLNEGAKKTAKIAESLYKEGYAIKLIAQQLGISRMTVYKYLDHRQVRK